MVLRRSYGSPALSMRITGWRLRCRIDPTPGLFPRCVAPDIDPTPPIVLRTRSRPPSLSMDTPSKVVELNIVEEWWLWRGFLPFDSNKEGVIDSPELKFGFGSAPLRDPMNEPDFDEAHAFPLLKPSINVLGPPRRSRKQRGWYQVRLPSGPVAAASGGVVPSSMRSAADLPPELIHIVAGSLRLQCTRRQLGLCAGVCRHWADVLLPVLFKNIHLRSSQDVLQLRAFQDNPLSKLSQYKCHYIAEQTLASAPFLHTLSTIRSPSRLHLAAMVQGPVPSGRPIRSIAPHIPRSLPPAAFSRIDTLDLEDIHFQHFIDFRRLVLEMRNLDQFCGNRISWPNLAEPPAVPTKPWRGCPHILFNDCTAHQRWLALWLTDAPLRKYEYCVLVREVDETLQGVEMIRCFSRAWSVVAQWSAPGVFLWLQVGEYGQRDNEKSWIMKVGGDASTWIASINWPKFARILSSLTDVQYITVQMKEGSKQRAAYMEHAHRHLESLSRERGIRLDVEDPPP